MALRPEAERHSSEEKRTETNAIRRALLDNEDWYQDLVEHSQDLLCIHDLQGWLLSVNPAPAGLLGYSVEEILQIPMRELVAPDFRGEFDFYLQNIARTGEAHGLLAVITRAGERRIWEYHNTLRTEGVVSPIVRGTAHDVTERTHAEKQLRETNEAIRQSEGNYRMFVAQSSEGIFRQELDAPLPIDLPEDELVQRILRDSYMGQCNDALARMYGLTSSCEFVGKRLTEMVPPEDPRNIELAREFIRSGFRVLERESHEIDIHGNPKVFLNSMIGTVQNGMLVRTWGIQRDITDKIRLEEERRQTQEALQRSEAHFRLLFEQASDGIFITDAQGRFIDVNSAGAAMLGRTRDEVLQLSIADIVIPGERHGGGRETIQYAESKAARAEWTLQRKDGSLFDVEVVDRRLPDGRMQVIIRDITGRKQNESELRKVTEELRLAKEKLTEEKQYLEEAIGSELGFGEIIGHSDALADVRRKVAKVAASDATVLLLGETGTGKELVARALHQMSNRKGASFIKVNCAAIPSGLLESELFGHEKGAFTGAVGRKLGRLELADRGTLFLDEIGEIPLNLQPKLLRVLQDHEFERLGGTQTKKVNFRLLAATNRDLLASVAQKEFRSDLYYRLNVFPIRIPPLRERRADIQLLIEHFVRKYSARMGKSIRIIPTKTKEALVRWSWPGNIRELENFIERSVILTSSSVLQAPLGELSADQERENTETFRGNDDKEHIVRVLRECKGQLGGPDGAAARLGLKRTTLQSKLSQLRIKPRNYRH